MITLTGITKSFPDGKENRIVLDQVNLQALPGSITAIMGRSGCGKTTLLYILAGLIQPNEGKYLFNDQELCLTNRKKMQEYRLHNIGYIMQEDTLLYDRTVEENILLGARFLRHNRKAVHEEMEGLANQLGIAPYLSKRPSKLSGGENNALPLPGLF